MKQKKVLNIFIVPERKQNAFLSISDAALNPVVCNHEREIVFRFCTQEDEIEVILL